MLPTRRLLNLIYHWRTRGITPESLADVNDALTQAGQLDVIAGPRPPVDDTPEAQQSRHIPGTAPRWIKPPNWWKGDRAAWQSSVRAAQELGEPAAKGVGGIPAAPRPQLGLAGSG